MIRIRWRWCLPVAQVILALALHVYESREHRHGAYSAPLFGLRYNPNFSPAPAGRLSLGINFPAVVLAYPFRNVYGTVFADDTEYTNIYIQVRDLYYFSGVAVFWWLVGLGLDRRRQHSQRRWSRKARFAAKACGLGFGLLCLVFAQSMIRATYEPQRDIGLCGLVWSCGLIAFFTWQLVREAGAGDTTRRVLRIATIAMFGVAALWIGGPFGLTQALGEYLRPSTLMEPEDKDWHCSPSDTPPADLMRLVNEQVTSHHLTLQMVTVCRDERFQILLPSPLIDCDFGQSMTFTTFWIRLKRGCNEYQFRRHFTTWIATRGEDGPYVARVTMIQSRWDFLRLNWNKGQRVWFWPYPGILERAQQVITKDPGVPPPPPPPRPAK